MLWFNFVLGLNFFSFVSNSTTKKKFEPRIELNHKFSAACLSCFILLNCELGDFKIKAWGLGGFHIKVMGMLVVSLRGKTADFDLT